MRKIVLVVAKSRIDFDYYTREISPSKEDTKYIFASDHLRIKGLHDVEVVFYGNWYAKSDSSEILKEIQTRGLLK